MVRAENHVALFFWEKIRFSEVAALHDQDDIVRLSLDLTKDLTKSLHTSAHTKEYPITKRVIWKGMA